MTSKHKNSKCILKEKNSCKKWEIQNSKMLKIHEMHEIHKH